MKKLLNMDQFNFKNNLDCLGKIKGLLKRADNDKWLYKYVSKAKIRLIQKYLCLWRQI